MLVQAQMAKFSFILQLAFEESWNSPIPSHFCKLKEHKYVLYYYDCLLLLEAAVFLAKLPSYVFLLSIKSLSKRGGQAHSCVHVLCSLPCFILFYIKQRQGLVLGFANLSNFEPAITCCCRLQILTRQLIDAMFNCFYLFLF